MDRHWLCVVLLFLMACGSKDTSDLPTVSQSQVSLEPVTPIRQRKSTDSSPATKQPKLGEDEVRVALAVLPGDADVEINKVPALRRNGLVELVGKPGDEFRVDIEWGTNQKIENMVKIESNGASPARIDAEEESKPKLAIRKASKLIDMDD